MGLLSQVLGNVIASRVGGGGIGGGLGGLGGVIGGGLGRGGMIGGGMMGGGLGKAMMVMLAARAAQEYMQRRQSTAAGGADLPAAGREGTGGGLGGMLAGAGGAGGLGALIEQFKRNGHGDTIDSWIKPGPNRRLAPEQLADALGHDTVDDLAQEAGMPKKALLEELSETLPDTVDQLTPDGRIPPAHEL